MMRGSDFAELRAFAEVAHRRSFARAAEHLLARLIPAMEEMDAAVSEAHDGRARPSGVVRLQAPRPAYTQHVEPALGQLQQALPDVILDISIDDTSTNMAAIEYDLVVRRAEFVDSSMVARDLGECLRHVVVASPDYLAACGAPSSPEDLVNHRCIQWRPTGGETQRWRFDAGNEPMTMAIAGPLIVSHCDAAIAAALQSIGIAYVLESYATPYTTGGRLVSILTGFLPSFSGWKLCHLRQARLSAAASAIAEVLAKRAEAMVSEGTSGLADPGRVGEQGCCHDIRQVQYVASRPHGHRPSESGDAGRLPR